MTPNIISAQTVEETSTAITSEGTVSEFGPQVLVVKTETATAPLRYTYTKTTTYVDEEDNPVAVTNVKSGLPVTVYYTKVGDSMVASKVMLRKTVTVPAPAPTLETTQTTTTSAGTISEFGPERISIRTESSPDPLRYSYSKTTTYVDEAGRPVSIKTVKSGLPVTVYYTMVGDTMVASRVVVRKLVTVPTRTPETTQTTTTSAGTISEFGPERILIRTESSPDPIRYSYSKTTTYVDEDGNPVAVTTVKSGLPVTVHYTKVGDTLMVSKVIVRKAAVVPPPVVETKRTTTTTIRK